MRVFLISFVLVSTAGLSCVALAMGGEVCIVPSQANGTNATVDCDTICLTDCDSGPGRWVYDNAVTGYSTTGAPCATDLCPGDQIYGWSISASSTDPSVNSGALPVPLASLYLWFSCHTNDGMSAAEFDLVTTGKDIVHLSTDFLNGVLNAGTFDRPLLAVGGCPDSDFLAARLNMMVNPVSVEGTSWGQVKSLYR